jgi:hypothetical protein
MFLPPLGNRLPREQKIAYLPSSPRSARIASEINEFDLWRLSGSVSVICFALSRMLPMGLSDAVLIRARTGNILVQVLGPPLARSIRCSKNIPPQRCTDKAHIGIYLVSGRLFRYVISTSLLLRNASSLLQDNDSATPLGGPARVLPSKLEVVPKKTATGNVRGEFGSKFA